MRRHVLFVHHGAYPLFNPADRTPAGGAELQLYLMATELARDPRFRVSFLVSAEAAPGREVREGVEIHGWRPSRGALHAKRSARDHLRYLRLVRDLRPDALVHRGAGQSTLALALACRLGGARFVHMTAHDSDLGVQRPPWWRGAGGALRWRLYRIGLRLADVIVVQHEAQRAALATTLGRRGVVRPCVQRMPETPGPSPDRCALWVARAVPWKRPEVFLALARRFPAERFVMICPPAADAGYHARLAEAAAREGNVAFHGGLPLARVEEAMRGAWVLVNTSTEEGFPNTFVQAWKHGTPVISLAVDPGGVLARRGAGIACGGDEEALARGLARVFGEPGARAALGRAAFALAREAHDIRRQIEEDKRMFLGGVAETGPT